MSFSAAGGSSLPESEGDSWHHGALSSVLGTVLLYVGFPHLILT